MNLTVQAQPATQTILAESGLALHVPSFNGDSSFELRFREQGRRLYTPRDALLADSLLSLTRRVAALWQQREEATHAERGRIMRALRDDVAARLLTLVHRANDTSFQNLARQALTALRDTIYTLDTNGGKALEDVLDDLRFEVRERLEAVEMRLDWRMEGDPAGRLLSPRQHINLQRIVQELVSNAIHHSNASLLRVLVMTCEAEVILKICDNGVGGDATQWVAGKGLHNVTNRTQELGGQITWTDNPSDGRGCCVRLSLPLK
jgi:signal transduction histidine kinase